MKQRYLDIYDRLLRHEGGFTKNPKDRGNWTGGQVGVGELKGTNKGISAMSYPDYDLEHLTEDEIREIYYRDYWQRIKADEIPQPLDEFLFDFAVNSGASAAAVSLQGALGVLQDGVIGPKTLGAFKGKDLHPVLRQVFVDRAMIFALSPVDKLFGRGWFARLFDKTAAALRMIG